jgi:hypothetical protein
MISSSRGICSVPLSPNNPLEHTVLSRSARQFLSTILGALAALCLALAIGVRFRRSWAEWAVTMPPGTFIGILGAMAVVLTLFECLYDDRLRKASTLIVVFSLLYFEVVDLQKGQQDQQAQFRSIMDNFSYVQKLLIDYKSAAERLARLSPVPHVENERTSLKRQAAQLSHSILEFLVNQKVQPGYGQGGYGTSNYGGAATEEKKVMELYRAHYESEVVRVRNEFAKRGITDPELDVEYQNPVNSYSLRLIAERLGALSDRL